MISRKVLRELFFFCMVGGVATVTHYIVAVVAVEWLSFPVYVGNTIGYMCAVCVSFYGHSKATFNKPMTKNNFIRFIIASLSTLLLSQLVLFAIIHTLALTPRVSLALVVFYIAVQGYLLNKFWVYRESN